MNRIVAAMTALNDEKEDAEERLNDLSKIERDIDERIGNNPSGLLKTLLYKVVALIMKGNIRTIYYSTYN